ncbi:hypothetical protein Trydic_g19806 [Trypoxylus dichotomus]
MSFTGYRIFCERLISISNLNWNTCNRKEVRSATAARNKRISLDHNNVQAAEVHSATTAKVRLATVSEERALFIGSQRSDSSSSFSYIATQNGIGEHSNGQKYFCNLEATEMIEKYKPKQNSTRTTENEDLYPQIKLPPIKLQVFSGAYDEWLAFYDTYSSLIHSNDNSIQPKKHTIVERQERSSHHTVQLDHEAESSKDATLQNFTFNSTAQMKTSSAILGTANVDISNEEGPNMEASPYSACHMVTIQLKQFWELEEVTSKSILTKEERACEENFVTHHKQEADGRFVVRLPFKNNIEQLGESKILAEQRLHSLERKFQANATLKKEYSQYMDEYLTDFS